MCLQDTFGILVRSRFQQNSEEEKGSLFHAARESKNERNNISALKSNNIIINDQEEIESIITSFFYSLFNGHHNVNL